MTDSTTTSTTQGPPRRDLADLLSSSPVMRFMRTESGSAGLLVAATLIALIWANSPWSGIYHDLLETPVSLLAGDIGVSMSLHHWINDGLMVVFFFVIGMEVRHEFSVGELTERRQIVVPLIAGVGGMIVPAAIYLALNHTGEAAHGWGAVIGTDTAFLLGVLALVGPTVSTQLRVFLLTLTVIDDIVAVSVIGIAYTDHLNLAPLIVAAVALAGLVVLDRLDVWRASPYLALVALAWLSTLDSGVHASIAGMLAGLLIPASEPSRARVEAAATGFRAFRQSPLPSVQRATRDLLNRTISVNERLQEALHGCTSYVVVPVFALANAGVDLRGGVLGEALGSPVTWGVAGGLVLGKLIGIGTGALSAVRLGLGKLPQGVGSGHVLAGGALSGIGFTVALLIIELAFDDPALRDQATVGVLLSVVLATGLGWALFAIAARFFGQRDAERPRFLSEPVDPGRDHIYGHSSAEFTLVEYLDFECPFCAQTTGVTRDVCDHFGDRIRYVPRHFPLTDIHPHADLAAIAAEAAAKQGTYWEMHNLLFAHQDELELEDLVGYAGQLGLDTERFLRDLQDDRVARRVRRDVASGIASGVRSTPTFFIGNQRHVGPYDAQSLIAALEYNASHPDAVNTYEDED
ncbi:MAG: Na+/H+ antiporter NhaA [Propionicimonas sp.]|uniref:Na+/H+ antiporter NhaA n=1 Tax=Propionicimonas sp. TaxID=1955623 RepID=UPI002B1F012F|nr:Na+/H+ antiporter NhaA [Propionicimonas sp.]MEA4942931.1 Na+/H+ antiporter NhaA [Propionicimonas sp.]